MKEEAPNYLINVVPNCEQNIRTRNNHIPTSYCRKDCFNYSFFPSTLNDWFHLDDSIGNSRVAYYCLFVLFKTTYTNICNPKVLKFLTRLRLGFSYLSEHRFRHNFQDWLNLFCSCNLDIEDTLYYLQGYHFFQNCINLINRVKFVPHNAKSLRDNVKIEILLCGNSCLDRKKNKVTLEATLTYIKNSERFLKEF